MKQLLVVTCNKHRSQFLSQSESFDQFLEPVDLHVVINEADPESWIDWFNDSCAGHLQSHRVVLHTCKDMPSDLFSTSGKHAMSGWHVQQVCKLAFSLKTYDSYVVLDSKNCITGPTRFIDFVRHSRVRSFEDEIFYPFYKTCLRTFTLPIKTQYRPTVTPYIFEPSVVLKLFDYFGGIKQFADWFMCFDFPSEFIVYDLFAQSILEEQEVGVEHAPYKMLEISWDQPVPA